MDSEHSRLKHARELKGLTLQQLAAKIGYSVGTISGIENGHDKPSKRLKAVLLSALNLNQDWLATGKGQPFAVRAERPDVADRKAASESEVEGLLRRLPPSIIDEVTRRVHRDCLLECDVKINQSAFRRGWVEATLHYGTGEAPPDYPSKVRISRIDAAQASEALNVALAKNSAEPILIPALPDAFLRIMPSDGDRLRMLTPFCWFALARAAVRMNFGDAAAPKILRDLRLGHWLELLEEGAGGK